MLRRSATLNKPIKLLSIPELIKTNPAFFKSFYSSPVAKALMFGKTGKYFEINIQFLKLFECKRDQVIGKTPDELCLWANQKERKNIKNELSKNKKKSVNFDIKTLKGNNKNIILSTEVIEINGDKYLLGDHLDNTDKKDFENRLKESEEQYKFLFYKNPQPMWIFDFDTLRFIAVNDSAIDHYGYSKNEFLQMKLTDIRPEKDVSRYLEYRKNIIHKNEQYNSTFAGIWKHKKKNGELIDVEITRTPVKFENKNAILILANDVTSILKAQENLRKKNEEMDILYNSAKEISSTLNPNEIYETIYKVISKLIPCDGISISSYNKSNGYIKCIAAWIKSTKLDISKFPEMPLDTSGSGIQSKAIITGKSIIMDDFDKYAVKNTSVMYVYKDNSIKKKLQKGDKVNRSALIVPMLLNNSVIGVIQVLSYNKNAYNQEHLQLMEALSAELSAASANAMLHNQAQTEIAEREKAEAALQKKTKEISLLYKAQLELTRTLNLNSVYDNSYKIITGLMSCDSMIISLYNKDDKLIKVQTIWTEGIKPSITDYPPIPLAPEGYGIQSIVIRTGKPLLINDYKSYFKKSINKFSIKNDIIKKNTKSLYTSALIVPMKIGDNVIGTIQVLSLKENIYNENDLMMLESFTTPITAATANALLYEQAQNEISFRKKTETKLLKTTKEISDLYEISKELSSSLKTHELYQKVFRIINSSFPECDIAISIYDSYKKTIRLEGLFKNGFEVKTDDFPLINFDETGKGLQSSVIISKKTRVVYDYKDYIKNTGAKFYIKDDGTVSYNKDDSNNIAESALIVPLLYEGNAFGTIQLLNFNKNSFTEDNVKMIEALASHIAITFMNAKFYQQAQKEIAERIKKETELKLIRKNLEEAQRIANIGSWLYDIRVDRIFNSSELYRILGIENGQESFMFDEAMDYIHPDDKMRTIQKIKEAVMLKCNYENEDRILRPDGEIRYVKVVGEPMYDENSVFIGIQGTIQDITDMKKINDELVKSLGEKEIMIKEIHHRVKNNLQIVSSLLRLQSEKITDKTVLVHFRQSEQRIKSMALIHQQLYKTKDLSRINFRDYINELCSYLLSANDTASGRINLKVEAEELYFRIDTALPCGLIVNELFTNAVKHAFPGGAKGNIFLKLYKDINDNCCIMVKDDGIGALSLDLKNTTSLGMELVNTLTEQLDGKISITVNNGTEVKLSFKEMADKK